MNTRLEEIYRGRRLTASPAGRGAAAAAAIAAVAVAVAVVVVVVAVVVVVVATGGEDNCGVTKGTVVPFESTTGDSAITGSPMAGSASVTRTGAETGAETGAADDAGGASSKETDSTMAAPIFESTTGTGTGAGAGAGAGAAGGGDNSDQRAPTKAVNLPIREFTGEAGDPGELRDSNPDSDADPDPSPDPGSPDDILSKETQRKEGEAKTRVPSPTTGNEWMKGEFIPMMKGDSFYPDERVMKGGVMKGAEWMKGGK